MISLIATITIIVIGSVIALVIDNLLGIKFDKNSWWQQLGHKIIWMAQGAAIIWAMTL